MRPEGIPQGKNRIICESLCFMHLMVNSAVSFVHIFKNIGSNGSMVKSCVKNTPLLFRSAFHLNF